MPPQTRVELREWLKLDLDGYIKDGVFPPAPGQWRWWHRFLYPLIHWQRVMRTTEFVVHKRKGRLWLPWVFYWRWNFVRHSIRLNLEIPLNVFGPGLTVVHYGNIVINPKVRVGKNCRIHPGACLGELKEKNPTLGDNVYIGNGAIVIGDIRVGDRAKIGPHALVRHSVADDAVIVSEAAKSVSRN